MKKIILILCILLPIMNVHAAVRIWKGTTSGTSTYLNFTNKSYWIGNIVPVDGDDIIIPNSSNRNPKISSGSYSFNSVTIESNKSLYLATNSVINVGNCSGGGKLEFVGDLTFSGNLQNIKIDIGSLITPMSLSINLDSTTLISNGGNIIGDITILKTIGKYKTHYISFPVQVQYNNLSDDCQVINPNTNLTRLFYFDNTLYKWVAVNNINNYSSNTIAYSNYFSNGLSDAYLQTYIVDMTGYYEHDLNVNIINNLTTFNGKYIMIPNPKISNIDWDLVVLENSMSSLGGVYFWDNISSSYVSYIDGVSSTGTQISDNIIPPMQSFFIYVDSTNAGDNLNISLNSTTNTLSDKLAKTTFFNRNIYRFSNSEQSTVVATSEIAKDTFEFEKDAQVISKNGKNIYTYNYQNSYTYSINQMQNRDVVEFYLVNNDTTFYPDFSGNSIVLVNDKPVMSGEKIVTLKNETVNVKILSNYLVLNNIDYLNSDIIKIEIIDPVNMININNKNDIQKNKLYFYKYYYKNGSIITKKIIIY